MLKKQYVTRSDCLIFSWESIFVISKIVLELRLYFCGIFITPIILNRNTTNELYIETLCTIQSLVTMYNTSHLLQSCMCSYYVEKFHFPIEREREASHVTNIPFLKLCKMWFNLSTIDIFIKYCQLHYIISCPAACWLYFIHPWSDTSCNYMTRCKYFIWK